MSTYPISSGSRGRQSPAAVSPGRPDALAALLAGGVALFIYGRTLTPGLLPGDGGEFQTLAALWGHSHPTGYPVYLTLAKLFTFLPAGEIAYRVNLFSALMGAVTIAGLYFAGRIVTKSRLISFAGAMAMLVSPTFWSQAVIAEVYTAGAAFFIWIIAALLFWQSGGSRRALFIAGLLGGLSLGVHMSVALLAPATLLFLLLLEIGDGNWAASSFFPRLRPPILGALTGAGITILLFLLMNWNNPKANYFNSVIEPSRSAWGLTAADLDGPFDRLLFGWSAKQFRPFMFAETGVVMPQQAADYWQNLPDEFGVALLAVAAVGAVYMLMRRRQTAVLLLVALLIQLLYFFNYQIWDLHVFYIPSYVLLALLATAGTGALADGLNRLLSTNVKKRGYEQKSAFYPVRIDAILALVILIFAVFPIYQPRHEALAAGEVPFEFDDYPVYEETLHLIAAATVLDLPENAIVFTDWDMMWPFYYTAVVENGRTDLTFIETFPADDQDRLADSVITYIHANKSQSPIIFSERLPELTEAGFFYAPMRVGPSRMVKLLEEQN